MGSVDRVDRVETLTRRRALERGYWFARGLLDAPPLTALRGQVRWRWEAWTGWTVWKL
jgi:hypothetical protein